MRAFFEVTWNFLGFLFVRSSKDKCSKALATFELCSVLFFIFLFPPVLWPLFANSFVSRTQRCCLTLWAGGKCCYLGFQKLCCRATILIKDQLSPTPLNSTINRFMTRTLRAFGFRIWVHYFFFVQDYPRQFLVAPSPSISFLASCLHLADLQQAPRIEPFYYILLY